MTPWMGWERRENDASSALLLSLPKLDVNYRKAQANKLDLSTLVQIQVSSTWFCSCLYGNNLASIGAFCNVAKSVKGGSELALTWSIASQSYGVVLETQSWSPASSFQGSCWQGDFWDVGLWGTQFSPCLLRISCRNEPTTCMLGSPCAIVLFGSSKSPKLHCFSTAVQEMSQKPLSRAKRQALGARIWPF